MQPLPIKRVRESAEFENKYGVLYNDEVTTGAGVGGRYLRWRWAHSGVAVVPRFGEQVGLVPMFRYAIQTVSLEIPRGGIEPGESITDAARRELREEMGLTAERCSLLGSLYADTGLIENAISVVVVDVSSTIADRASVEAMESIGDQLLWLDRPALRDALRAGRIRCGVTIASLALLDASSPERR